MITTEDVKLELVDHGPQKENLLLEVLNGLSQKRKSLPAKLLYDEKGSEIFEEICLLPSYYPTRTETKILTDNAAEIVRMIGKDSLIIEPGSGAAEKVRILFSEMKGRKRYIPVEISREILLRTSRELIEEYEGMEIFPVCSDFTRDLSLPVTAGQQRGKRVVFFPGSTIGNLDPDDARFFLKNIAKLVGAKGGLLIGVDRKKDSEVLRLAYNDPEGVTADFNLNLLNRINRELNGTFDRRNFAHEAIYNPIMGRIEMHLRSVMPQLVRINQKMFRFHEGETIHTENSYKYTVEEFSGLAERAGLRMRKFWTDDLNLFAVYYFEVE